MMNGVRHSLAVHRVIASVFLGDITGMEVDHLDFNKKNNFVENLEIVTKKENMRRYHNSEHAQTAYKNIATSKIKHWNNLKQPGQKARSLYFTDDVWNELLATGNASHTINRVLMEAGYGVKKTTT